MDLDVQRPHQRRDAKLQHAARESRPRIERARDVAVFALRLAVFARRPVIHLALRGAHHLHVDVQVGDVRLLDLDLDGSGAVIKPEAAGVDQAGAPECDHRLGRRERRSDQHRGGLADGVFVLVRDQLDLLLLQAGPPWLGRSARHPHGQLALVPAPGVV